MPSPSPLCQVRYGANAYVNVPYGAPFEAIDSTTLDIRLADTAGVRTWELTCIGTDDTSLALTVTRDAPPAMVAHATTPSGPGLPKSWIFQSRINDGLDANQRPDASLTTTFKVQVLSYGGQAVGALNETFEGNASFGWLKLVNTAIRAIFRTGGDLRGDYIAQYVKQITGDALGAIKLLFTSYNWPTSATALTASVGDIGNKVVRSATAGQATVTQDWPWPDESSATLTLVTSYSMGSQTYEVTNYWSAKKTAGTLTVTQRDSDVPSGDAISGVVTTLSSASGSLRLSTKGGTSATNIQASITGVLLKRA